MDDSSRNGQVIAAANWYVAEWRLQRSLTFVEIVKVVTIAIRKRVRALGFPRQPEKRGDDVVVHQDRRESLGRLLAEHEPALERLRRGGGSGGSGERARRRGAPPQRRPP